MVNNLIHPTAIIDEGAVIGQDTRIWHFSHVMGTARIGSGCSLGQNVFVGASVQIGNRVKIQNNVSVFEGVEIANDVFLGPSVVFTNVLNPRSFIEQKDNFQPTLIDQGASIGANSTIICGVTIGKYAMVGAGSVITKSVADYALVYGNPARQYGWVTVEGIKLTFSGSNDTITVNGFEYILKNGTVTRREAKP